MDFIRQLFCWWRGQTFGTRLFTLVLGKKMGTDDAGNIYYRHRQLESRRWVIYNGTIEASKIPPEWHAWLHNMVRTPPRADAGQDALSWFKPHLANLTGTPKAYKRNPPPSSNKQETNLEYEAWQPPAQEKNER